MHILQLQDSIGHGCDMSRPCCFNSWCQDLRWKNSKLKPPKDLFCVWNDFPHLIVFEGKIRRAKLFRPTNALGDTESKEISENVDVHGEAACDSQWGVTARPERNREKNGDSVGQGSAKS